MTKKHLARAERERIQRRWILGGTIATFVLVVGLIIFGWANVNLTPVATVNGVDIETDDYQGRIRLAEAEIINQAFFQEQIDQLPQQLGDRVAIGQRILDEMIEDELIRQEIEKRGIVLSEEEVEVAIAEAFGYFPKGTPTPFPTFTPDPTALARASITPTITEGPSPTPTQTATAGPSPTVTSTPTTRPTSTPYTEDAFQENLKNTLESLADNYGIRASDFRGQFFSQLRRRKLFEEFEEVVPREQEHVLARHILVEDEETAQEVLDLLEQGELWVDLAAEYSTDESNKERGGDLGWFPRGRMVPEFEEAAFNAPLEEVVGPVETTFGWHLIEVLEKEVREVDEFTYQFAVQDVFNEWLTEALEEAEVDINPFWQDKIPPSPNLRELFGQPAPQ
jgi:parvulin-like peptidyl-prolyl isomerase